MSISCLLDKLLLYIISTFPYHFLYVWIGHPVFGSWLHSPTFTAKLIYSRRQHLLEIEVALETKLIVAFLFNESKVTDALYVC